MAHLSKLESLDGNNYKRWAQKLLMFFEQLDIDYVLFSDCPTAITATADSNSPSAAVIKQNEDKILKYEKDNKTVRFHLLNLMTNNLFDLFMVHKSSKLIWEALEKKYGADDAGKQKYVVGKWLAFQMVDDKPVMDQVHVYENLCADVLNEDMKICEVFQANVLLEKFPPSWREFRNNLKHRKEFLSLQDLISHMRIEEANRIKDNQDSVLVNVTKANLVESAAAPGSDKFKGKGKKVFNKGKKQGKVNKPSGKIQKKTFVCYVCGKPDHKAYQCPQRQGSVQKEPPQANLAVSDEVIAAVVVEANLVENRSDWILDTGASRHFCSNKELLHDFQDATGGECVYMGNAATAGVLGHGKVTLKLTSGKTLSLSNVLYVPTMRRNLVSGALLNKAGLKIVFEADKVVMTRGGEFVGKGYLSGGLFILNVASSVSAINKTVCGSAYIAESLNLWHGRLGHVNVASIKRLRTLELIPNLSSTEFSKCPICVEAKFTKKPCKTVTQRTTQLLELVHTDLADFQNTRSRGGKFWYISFVDDYSRFTKLYLLKTKSEAGEAFLKYKAEVENQLDRKIKRVRSDRGREYENFSWNDHCEKLGIIHELSAPYVPQQNGIAERKNRSLKNMMNAMLVSSGLPDEMWGEAVLSACHVLNRVPHKRLDKTPYELWKGYPPNLSFLRVWGCLAKVGLPDYKKSNIGPKTFDAVFIGYAHAAYRFMSLSDRSICEYRDAEFFEHVFPLKKGDVASVPSCSSPAVDLSTCSTHDVLPTCDTPADLTLSSSSVDMHASSSSVVDEPRRSKRPRVAKDFGSDFVTAFLSESSCVDLLSDELVYAFMIEEDPKTFDEAMRSVDASFWKEAIKSELDSIVSNSTWELTDLPKGSKTIDSKWIFKKKLRPDGTIERFKARLVIRGFTQRKGLDYFDTYSPVTKIATIRTLLALAAIHDLVIHQMDVKTAFLNGDLEEEIYMSQPEGFVVLGQEDKVCKLRKSLYGLKQAPKQWYEKFDSTVVSNGFIVNNSDSCVYSKLIGSDCVIICLYVDDMLIFGNNLKVVNDTKLFLSSKFEMKDLGEADVILGVRLKRVSGRISLSQSHYVEKVLKRFNSFDVVPVSSPYDSSIHLTKNLGESVSQSEYAKIIGSLMYLMNCTRPDIAYAVSRLSRYTHNPSNEHWSALHRLLRYLKGTVDFCLHYSKFPAVLEGFCDANWVSGNDEISSTSGYVFTLGGGAISWKSSKQTCIARSTMESEFIALELAGQEAEWLRNLLFDVPLWGGQSSPVSLHCDSQAAIGVAKNSVYNGKKRHIRIRHGVVKQLLKNGVISLDYVRSERNLADPFTKGLSRRVVLESSRGMGLKPIS